MFGKCPVCAGKKFVLTPDSKSWAECPYCRGTGDDPGVPRFFEYKFQVTLTANQVLLNQRIVVNGDAPFRIRLLMRVKTGDFRVRLFNSSGQYYSSSGEGGTNDRVRDTCLFGDAQLPFLLVPHIDIPPSGFIGFDLEDVSNAQNAIELVFAGHKLYPTPTGN